MDPIREAERVAENATRCLSGGEIRKVKLRTVLLSWTMIAARLLYPCHAQELAPRAYLITPLHFNAVTMSWAFYEGNIDYNGAIPISEGKGTYNLGIFSLYHSLGLFGRSANVVASLPYAVGNFQGILDTEQHVYRSGLADSAFRFAVNLKGGPSMPVQEFAKWKQNILLGASLKVVAPTGQYDPTKLINWGANRWAFKPEFGYSQAWGKLVLDGYAGVWFFTRNQDFWSRNAYYSGTRYQTQNPIGAWEGHLSYDFKRGYWASLDGNLWLGGTTSVLGVENPLTNQLNSRLGGTLAARIAKHQSLKFSYSDGTYTRFGGDYQSVSVGWQYSWLGRPN
jgi:hypothetical protein